MNYDFMNDNITKKQSGARSNNVSKRRSSLSIEHSEINHEMLAEDP